MGNHRVENLSRAIASRLTRRSLAGMLGLSALGLPAFAEAGKHNRKRKRKQKVRYNAYGCVDVGKFCKRHGQCCSGFCFGKFGNGRCRARGESPCQGDQDACLGPVVTCSEVGGGDGVCFRTTGKASFCGNPLTSTCVACVKDADCEPSCGPSAACVVCAEECGGTECVARPGSSCSVV